MRFGITIRPLKRSDRFHTRSTFSREPRKTNTTTISENGTTAFFPNRYCTFCLAKKYHPTMVENAKNRRQIATNAGPKPLRLPKRLPSF